MRRFVSVCFCAVLSTVASLGIGLGVDVAGASDGTLDATATARFGTGFNDVASAIALQTDGKILVGGSFTSYNGTSVTSLVRLNANGSLDTAFSASLGSGFDGGITDLAVQSDGKIIAVGGFDTVNGIASRRIVRINSDGTVDAAFSTAMGTGLGGGYACACAPRPEKVVVQQDGKIVIGGDHNSFDGQSANGLVRLQANGALDSAFVANSTAILDYLAADIALQPDGKILVSGAVSGNNLSPTASSLVRFNADGTLDTAFNSALNNGAGISGFSDLAVAVALQADGKIVLGGAFSAPAGVVSPLVARYSATGVIDTAFSTAYASGLTGRQPGFSSSIVTGLFVMQSGEIVVAGSFTTAGGVASPWLARLTATGAVDSRFSTNMLGSSNERVFDVIQLSDGSYVVVGAFTRMSGSTAGHIAVLGRAVPASTTTTTTSSSPATTSTTVLSNVAAENANLSQVETLPETGVPLDVVIGCGVVIAIAGRLIARRQRLLRS